VIGDPEVVIEEAARAFRLNIALAEDVSERCAAT
jgi:hypothetical protein